MECKRCHQIIDKNSIYCSRCGSTVDAQTQVAPKENVSFIRLVFLILVLYFVFKNLDIVLSIVTGILSYLIK